MAALIFQFYRNQKNFYHLKVLILIHFYNFKINQQASALIINFIEEKKTFSQFNNKTKSISTTKDYQWIPYINNFIGTKFNNKFTFFF
ncbi:hypothetical protein BpHYR1_039906 [Brachionus plicatilis]|uniref:Uncharacterized protein n=1 Tax=Brachionus plicatilis TaxID=10195 RepID=A0A3M7R217_BRAPC|nr:hypothetical protein BpHYR1_039906 [Brachionus plicatilis]